MRSKYQSLDKKYIWVHVEFEGRLSIHFGRKKRYKKSELFPRGSLFFFKWRGLKCFWKLELFWKCKLLTRFFYVKSCLFLRQPIVKFYRHHDTVHIYRLISRNKHFHVVCFRESIKKAPKKRLTGVVSKERVHSRKPNVLGISRYKKSTSGSMSNLMVGCLSRSQENRDLKKVRLFPRWHLSQ
jgi:hypothetical protein